MVGAVKMNLMKLLYIIGLIVTVSVSYGKFVPKGNLKEELKAEKELCEDLSKEELKEMQKSLKSIVGGISIFESLPPKAKEAVMAQMLGLLFTADDSNPYPNGMYYPANALYVDSKGKVQQYNKATDIAKAKKNLITQAAESAGTFGTDYIFRKHAATITKMCLKTFQYKIESLPRGAKYAWLAEVADLMYMKDGSDAYTRTSHTVAGSDYFTGSNLRNEGGRVSGYVHHDATIGEISYKEAQKTARFLDPDGNEYCNGDVWNNFEEKECRVKFLLHWCAELVGLNDVLALYSGELRAMREQRDKMMKK